jgi:hypothetical protein
MQNTHPVELPQFIRERNGSLWHRGSADAYYGREFAPHWYPKGTYNGERVENLTSEEIDEYNRGFRYQQGTGVFRQ